MTIHFGKMSKGPPKGAPSAERASVGEAGPMLTRASRVVLPEISPAAVESLNAFYRRRPALAFPVAGYAATMTVSWPPASDDVSGRCRLDLAVDGNPGVLTLSRSLIGTLVAGLDPDQGLDHLDPRHLALLLELALGDALSSLEASLGVRLAIDSVRTADGERNNPAALAFNIAIDGLASSAGALLLPDRQIAGLVRLLDRCAPGFVAEIALPVPVCVRVAATTCAFGEMTTLSPGDVVMADHCCQAQTAIAVLAEHLVAPAELTATGARITTSPARAHGSFWEWSMENGGDNEQAGLVDETDLDDIPVRLVFELGRVELSLAEVRTLAPGALIPMSRPAEESVDILANGRRIGRGSLVQIGGNLGIRIARLFYNG